jgi:hypothetical protein
MANSASYRAKVNSPWKDSSEYSTNLNRSFSCLTLSSVRVTSLVAESPSGSFPSPTPADTCSSPVQISYDPGRTSQNPTEPVDFLAHRESVVGGPIDTHMTEEMEGVSFGR